MGYQNAILAKLVARVCTIDCRPELAEAARRRLDATGITNVTYGIGDGARGWPEEARFDAILVTAAAADGPVREALLSVRFVPLMGGTREPD